MHCYFRSVVTFIDSQSYFHGINSSEEYQFRPLASYTPFPTLSSLLSSPIFVPFPKPLPLKALALLQVYTKCPQKTTPVSPPSSSVYRSFTVYWFQSTSHCFLETCTCSYVTKHPINNFVSCQSLSHFSWFVSTISCVFILKSF